MSDPPLRFAADRPPDVRATRLTQRYAYHRRALAARLAALARAADLAPGARVLDYGSADAPYRSLFPHGVEFVTADLAGSPHADIELDEAGAVPAPDGSFDLVLSTQVLEHVRDPGLHLAEAHRVLRPGGRLLLSTHGIFVLHPDPVDYWRWTAQGIERVVEDARFEVLTVAGVVGLVPTAIQLMGDSLHPRLPRPVRPFFTFAVESLVMLADRLQSQAGRDLNAQVFAVLATKPK